MDKIRHIIAENRRNCPNLWKEAPQILDESYVALDKNWWKPAGFPLYLSIIPRSLALKFCEKREEDFFFVLESLFSWSPQKEQSIGFGHSN